MGSIPLSILISHGAVVFGVGRCLASAVLPPQSLFSQRGMARAPTTIFHIRRLVHDEHPDLQALFGRSAFFAISVDLLLSACEKKLFPFQSSIGFCGLPRSPRPFRSLIPMSAISSSICGALSCPCSFSFRSSWGWSFLSTAGAPMSSTAA